MNWSQLYPQANRPELSQISDYIGSPQWGELRAHLESAYGVSPILEYSVCSGAPGWNLKYRKGGRALCTLYPAQGFFTCLVSIGSREAIEAELLLASCTEYLRSLYWGAKPFNGGRWLMIAVTSPEVLRDVQALIALRVRAKR